MTEPDTQPPPNRGPVLMAIVIAGAIAALVVSLIAGTPDELPGVALGSEVLLHAERVTAFTAALLFLLSVITRAAEGRLPNQMSTSGLGYSEADRDQGLQRQIDELGSRIVGLESELEIQQLLRDTPNSPEEPRQ